MKENQTQPGGANRLPLVGPGATTEFQFLNTTDNPGGKQLQSGGCGAAFPLVGPEATQEFQLLNTKPMPRRQKQTQSGTQTASRWSAPEIKIRL